MKILDNIKKIREFKNISQSDMAKKLSCSLATYGKIERCETALTIDRFEQIAEILCLKPEQLYTFDSTKNYFNV